MKYKNYIFDLYGTLIEIKTDENDILLWRKTAELYSATGVDYKASELRNTYKKMVKEEENILSKKLDTRWPEIRLEYVFERLFLEGKNRHSAVLPFDTAFLAASFRIMSRSKLKVFPHVIETFEKIKADGGRIFLLSNAQCCFTEHELEITGLKSYFDGIYISSDCEMKKPDRRFIKRVISENDLDPSETLMCGDDITADIGSASEAKITGVFLNTGHLSKREITKRIALAAGASSPLSKEALAFLHDNPPMIIEDGDIGKLP